MIRAAMPVQAGVMYGSKGFRNGAAGRRRFDDRQLSLISWSTPLLVQLVMLVMMCAQGHWMYVAMLVPGLLGSATTLTIMVVRMRADGQRNPQNPDSADSKSITENHTSVLSDTHAYPFDQLAHTCFEELHGIPIEATTWRYFVRGWLQSDPLCAIGTCMRSGQQTEFSIDLARAGPHAMVAGTTGSGKSELLISWCMALATAYSPDRLHFVFLDFKGGSTFNALERLPHTIGNVCDLDLSHAVRALNAIELELLRRETLVSEHRVSSFDKLPSPPARLVVVIDEFHALRDLLPDYMRRLNRLASLGRSLGMHLIVCTQNPMGQVHADMKANISLNICLRVTDHMQSMELIGMRDASLIPPNAPGAAYCNDGSRTTAFLCSAVQDVTHLVASVNTAARFCGYAKPQPLFSAPLARCVDPSDLHAEENPPWHSIPFALKDDGVLISTAYLDVSRGNTAIIGRHGSGKTNLMLHCASWLYDTGRCAIRFTRKEDNHYVTDNGTEYDRNERTIWFVDDADDLLNPFSTDAEAASLSKAIADTSITVIAALEKPVSAATDRCDTRIVFPSGDRPNDLMLGIPRSILDGISPDEYSVEGRGVLIRQATASLVQCACFRGF